MAIVLLATTLPVLEDRPEFDPLLAWFQEEAPQLALECTAAFREATARAPGTPGAFRKEHLYIKNATLDGREFYGDLIGIKLRDNWAAFVKQDEEDTCLEHPLLRNAISFQDYQHNGRIATAKPTRLAAQNAGDCNQDGLAAAISKIMGISTAEKFIDDATWQKLESGAVPPCLIDIQYYHTCALEKDFPQDHVARKILAGNGITTAADLALQEWDSKSGSTGALYKIPEAHFKHRPNASNAEKQRVIGLYHGLLNIATHQPIGEFDKRQDFKGVEIKAIIKAIRLVKSRVITDPDDEKLNSADWFRYHAPVDGTTATLEASTYDRTLSMQLAQILACKGYFQGTKQMITWRNLIKQVTDSPLLSQIANKYRIKAHLLFWVSLGFADPEAPATSATSFIYHHMSLAQNNYCIKALANVDTKQEGGRGRGRDRRRGGNRKRSRSGDYANAREDSRGGNKRNNGRHRSRDRGNGKDKINKQSIKEENHSPAAVPGKMIDSQLPSTTGSNSRPRDQVDGVIPWQWQQHVRKFPKTYGTSAKLMQHDSNIDPRCPCGIGGGCHSPDGCIALLLLKKWAPHAKTSKSSSAEDIAKQIDKLKKSKGV
jgi:hypothetical protein